MRDYQLISPSLDGILRHESIVYDGIQRPDQVLKLMDGPATRGNRKEGAPAEVVYTDGERKVIEQYLSDLYGIFTKKLSYFFVESEPRPDEEMKLQAMLQEMIKVKKLLGHQPRV